MTTKVTVRSTTGTKSAPRVIRTGDRVMGANKTWRIYTDGAATALYVSQNVNGTTIVNAAGKMQTCWHAGLSAGDLARSQAARIGIVTAE